MSRKASSNMLEILVVVDKNGVFDIMNGSFKVNLEYSERGENKKIIPMEIKYDSSQTEPILFQGEPKENYFGDCDKLIFTLNQDYVDFFRKYGYCDERFMTSGRLKIITI